MGTKPIKIQDSVYFKLKLFRNDNDLKSFTEAIDVLLKHYNQFPPYRYVDINREQDYSIKNAHSTNAAEPVVTIVQT